MSNNFKATHFIVSTLYNTDRFPAGTEVIDTGGYWRNRDGWYSLKEHIVVKSIEQPKDTPKIDYLFDPKKFLNNQDKDCNFTLRVDEWVENKKDAERFRLLMSKVEMKPASMDGPEYPSLNYFADLWNEQTYLSAVQRIIAKIDKELENVEAIQK